MPEPPYVRRSYAGGTQALQLLGQMNAPDLTFNCDPSVGNPANWPTGANGPFTVALDQGLPTFEKVLCSAFNPSTLQFTVAQYGSWNGRGYDGPGAQGHVPESNVPQVILTWSSIEADQANENAYRVLGGAAGTNDGYVLTTQAGKPLWLAPGQATAGLFPVGAMVVWPTVGPANFPVNFFECNGQALSMGTYSGLYAIIGGTFGSTGTSPSGTFNLPNIQDRYIVGMGTAIGTTMGATGGGRVIQLGQVPQHTHPIADQQHHHTPASPYEFMVGSTPTSTQYVNIGTNVDHGGGSNVSYDTTGTSNAWTNINATGVQTSGGGANFDQPFIALKWLMRCL